MICKRKVPDIPADDLLKILDDGIKGEKPYNYYFNAPLNPALDKSSLNIGNVVVHREDAEGIRYKITPCFITLLLQKKKRGIIIRYMNFGYYDYGHFGLKEKVDRIGNTGEYPIHDIVKTVEDLVSPSIIQEKKCELSGIKQINKLLRKLHN